jgi:hypothetical protein
MSNLLRLRPWNEHDVLDLPTLKARIDAGADVNVSLPNHAKHFLPLGVAAYHGNVEACRLLLDAGALPNRGQSPIVLAIEGRYSTWETARERMFEPAVMAKLVRVLASGGVNIDGLDSLRPTMDGSVRRDDSPLFSAIRFYDAQAAHELIKLGVNVELAADRYSINTGMNEYTCPVKPLLYASKLNRDLVVAALLRAGADDECLIDLKDGGNGFQVCVRRGHVAAAEYYIRERGEDLGQRVAWGNRTLMQWAKTPEMRALITSVRTELITKRSIGEEVSLSTENRPAQAPAPL